MKDVVTDEAGSDRGGSHGLYLWPLFNLAVFYSREFARICPVIFCLFFVLKGLILHDFFLIIKIYFKTIITKLVDDIFT